MGIAVQTTAWDERLRRFLADEGFHTVRYGNRDAPLSTFLDTQQQPDLGAVLGGAGSSATYLIEDLADDRLGPLDCLGVERAHLVGTSLGGMIASSWRSTTVFASPDRTQALAAVTAPMLVVHGEDDALVDISGAGRTLPRCRKASC